MVIRDRAKDIIKSGGEWISSVEIENIAIGHPAIANAAAIGVPHPKWDERPVLVAVKKEGANVSEADLRPASKDACRTGRSPTKPSSLMCCHSVARGRCSRTGSAKPTAAS